LNFVPKKPMEAALAEALAAEALPAWVVDAPRGVLVRGNGRGNAVWGVPVMALALDSAIPVLRSLRARLIARPTFAGVLGHEPATEILKFTTATGARAIRCTIRLLDDSVSRGLMLVVAEGALDAGAEVLAERSATSPADPASRMAAAEVAHSPSAGWGPVLGRAQLHGSGNAGVPLSDAETLREIARRIRQGSAGVSNANDAPDHRDDQAGQSGAPLRSSAGPAGRDGASDFGWPEHLAHEIRTPLAAIVSLAEVITEERLGAWPNERYRGYVRDILDSARHGLDVVDGILRDVPNPQGTLPLVVDLDLNAEVEAICTSLQPLAEKSSARLDAAVVSGLPRVIADKRNVRQMLLNLITNSIKHGSGPVRIKVTTGYELSGEVWVEVEDDGPGFATSATGAASSEKSARGAGQSRKAGLGLPLTNSLASANGARLDISSRPGGGVRARIVFGRDRTSPARE
jgi:anti-sigma regulatory factor (Ser/Thr protein kinase)